MLIKVDDEKGVHSFSARTILVDEVSRLSKDSAGTTTDGDS